MVPTACLLEGVASSLLASKTRPVALQLTQFEAACIVSEIASATEVRYDPLDRGLVLPGKKAAGFPASHTETAVASPSIKRESTSERRRIAGGRHKASLVVTAREISAIAAACVQRLGPAKVLLGSLATLEDDPEVHTRPCLATLAKALTPAWLIWSAVHARG
jgi:hypothetical protein